METISKIIQQTQPDRPGQRHRKLFDLARGLRFECGLADAPLRQLKTSVKQWFEIAKPNISTQSFTESWVDFCHAWPRVKKPLNENALNIAWDAVQSGNLPEESYLYDLEGVQKLCGLCWHLGHDQETFFLSMHDAGKLLGTYSQTVSRWLDVLKADCLIELLKKGKLGDKASTYRWTAKGAQ
ncbi:MAG: hypothetical protein ACNA71_08840 [Kiritimatiellia bacterium]